jgi:ABC-2 type transport system ATP-binding protein
MLRLEGLTKRFGDELAVDHVSMSILPGTLTILAGADGAGKSTLIKMIVGLVIKDAGEIYLDDAAIGSNYRKITSKSGYMPEKFSLYTDLSVEENLNFFADIYGVSRQRREELKQRLLEKTGMAAFKKRKAGELSGGMKQKLALSTILLSSPEMIFLDEPTTGVDPLSRIEFINIIDELKEEGRTIVVSTPYLSEAERGDEVVFIKKGKKIKAGKIKDMKAEFPGKLYEVIPKGNIFDVWEKIQSDKDLKDNVYIKGNTIRYMQIGSKDYISRIPAKEIKEEQVSLEDIYLYHEKSPSDGGDSL